MNPRRHPRQARLRQGDEAALRHAESCDRCADLLLDQDESVGRELRTLLATALSPRAGFEARTAAGAADRIGMQDLWDLIGDTVGGVGDVVRLVTDADGPVPGRSDDAG